MKTTGRWAYDKLAPGHYLWRSATGLLYEKTPDGTTRFPSLTPPPDRLPGVAPPRQAGGSGSSRPRLVTDDSAGGVGEVG